jgi:hypothetical protein
VAKIKDQPDATAPAAPGPAPLTLGDLGVADGVAPAALPRLSGRRPFLFMYHPERWIVLLGVVVPHLGRLVLQDGLCGVTSTKARPGQPSKLLYQDALADRRKRGWMELPLDVDGPGTSYLHRPAPGVVLSRWERAHAGSSVVTSDLPGYVHWLDGLVSSGKLPRPLPYVLDALHSARQAEVLRLRDLVRVAPSVQPELEHAEAIVKTLAAALAAASTTPVGSSAPVHNLDEE